MQIFCRFGETSPREPDAVLAAAILDRLLHFSTTINIRGQSYRPREQRKAGVFRDLAERQKEG
jgi:DNA replication protein DnaC